MAKKAKRKNSPAVTGSVDMIQPPRDSRTARYKLWAFVIWAAGVLFILLRWGKF